MTLQTSAADAVLLGQDLLRLQSFVQNGPAAKNCIWASPPSAAPVPVDPAQNSFFARRLRASAAAHSSRCRRSGSRSDLRSPRTCAGCRPARSPQSRTRMRDRSCDRSERHSRERWLWPSCAASPSPSSVVRPAVPPTRNPLPRESAKAQIKIADTLEAEHRIVNEKRNRGHADIGVRRSRSRKRSHRAGLRDAFFENLAVLRFFVVHQHVAIDRLIKLAPAARKCPVSRNIDSMPNVRASSGIIGTMYLPISGLQQRLQDGDKGRGRRRLAPSRALQRFGEQSRAPAL